MAENITALTEVAKPEETADENLFTWGDFEDDDNNNTDDNSGSDNPDKEDKKVVEKSGEEKKEYWQIAAEKVGVKADSEEDFVEKVSKKDVREVYVDEKDPAIRKMKNYARLDDSRLVLEDKLARGWSKEKAEKYVEKNKDNIEYEAEDIRASLNSSIIQRQREIEDAEKNTAEERRQSVERLHQNTKDYLSKTGEILGFKVGKDEQSTQKWQKGMEKYLISNSIFKDIDSIVKDAIDGKPERLVELAQFIKAKDGIAKGLMQKGKSKEAEKFLTDLQNSGDDTKPKGESVSTEVKDKNKRLDALVIGNN